ncbi:MAG: NADH-quinone oxidoreductase subunit C [Oligoflexia bacterium]|nr:MAG: NADH-quinone oxidoreductase subunit C [Oligoflexia bacterium]
MTKEELLQQVCGLADGMTIQEQSNQPTVNVPVEKWLSIAKTLKSDQRFQFDMLSDQAAIDWPQENQIELVYQFYSTSLGHNLMVCVRVSRQNPIAPSLYQLWPISEWQEREIFDLFGVRYSDHPDLRRLFLEDDWKGYPLLKDYKDDFMLERPW